MFVPSVFIVATAAVTAVLSRENLKNYHVVLSLFILALVYGGGVYFISPAGFTEILWLAALPLAAYVLLFIWYTFKRGWVPASLFIVIPPAAVIAGYVVVGPFDGLEWLARALASIPEATGYEAWTVPRLARSFFVISGLVYLSSPANAIIRGVLRRSGVFPEDDRDPAFPAAGSGEDTAGRGAVIGTLERWIAFALVLTGQYTALAFVIAAKSIARYKKINEEEKFGEYFLIGTLTSIGVALFSGLLVRRFLF
jgi:hypothetical protein